MGIADFGKRLLVGRKLRSTQLQQTLLPKRIALPVFASDPLSSVAYAPDEIFLILAFAGLAAYAFTWQVAVAIAVVMIVVIASYRENVRVYTSGGGDYEVATVNLGSRAGVTVASALLVDYVLTVAVSISSMAQYAATVLPVLQGYSTVTAVGAVLFLTAMNLRGVRESGTAFAIPAYAFMVAILGTAVVGFLRHLFGDLPPASSADLTLRIDPGFEAGFAGPLAAFLLLRAFASGCVTLTGVETVSNGVPAFRKPKGRNAAKTLALIGLVAVTMLISVVVLANLVGVRVAEDPATQLLGPGGLSVGEGYHQEPVISQIAASVFSGFTPAAVFVAAATCVILLLAANTAFNGFPLLGSILARDGYLPRQLHTRGDRLAYSNGIVVLAGFAILLIVGFSAQVTQLIQLYIVGVFVSFTLSQAGMVRHWNRRLRTTAKPAERASMRRSRMINAAGTAVTGTVLVVILVTKFTHGAWVSILAMATLYVLMRGIRRHYNRVGRELAIGPDEKLSRPAHVHAVVLVSKLHKPTMRALSFAKASRPDFLQGLTVDVDPQESRALADEWDRRQIPIPLKVLSSPYREVTRPVVDYVRSIRRASPRDLVAVYVPEYVVGHWWEQLLHNQSALRLKTRLLFSQGVMVISVPYQLESSGAAERRTDEPPRQPGGDRRGRRLDDEET